MEEWVIFAAESRERRVVQTAVQAIVAALLKNEEGAERSYADFGRELFPERVEKEKAHDEKSRNILESMGGAPIAVEPAAPTGSAWGESFRRNRIQVRRGRRKPESGPDSEV